MKRRYRTRAFYNLNTARSVGVLFNASTQEVYKTAKHFIAELHEMGLDVSGLGYVKNRDFMNYLPFYQGIESFTLEDVNWYYFPDDTNAEEFMHAEFDILIDLSNERHLALEFISGLSPAHLKVGKDQPRSRFYDLTFALKQEKSVEEIINLIKHYFQVLKSPKELVMN